VRRALTCLVIASALLSGCPPARKPRSGVPVPPKPVDRVIHVELQLPDSAAINWDTDPEPDGLRVMVRLYQASRQHGVRAVLVSGAIDFLLFEGSPPKRPADAGKPFFTWTFTRDQLPAYMARRYGLWCYAMQLDWGKRTPRAKQIWLVARYRAPEGSPIYSSPIERSMELK